MQSPCGSKGSLQVDKIFKKPACVPRKRPKQKVLDEETYIEEMGKIIQRDFFPDLEKLKAQHDYLEAKQKNDVAKLRELHAKYSGRTPPVQRVPSPATFETPAVHRSQQTPPIGGDVPVVRTRERPHLSLDQFLSGHTSQDNESFEEIMEESAKKQREKYAFLYNAVDGARDDVLALPSIEQQCALPAKKLNLDTWNYTDRNYIMYVPDGVAPTPDEQIELSRRRQAVVHDNTRLRANPFNDDRSKETIVELARSQARILDGKIGVDGKEVVPTDAPTIGGFSLVRTPSPRPGVAASPLMTWGEIEGTPFRLDGGDAPSPRTPGPSFKMAEPARREQLALALAERHRKQRSDPSPAARRFATSRLRLGVCSPSPRWSGGTPGTPRRMHTPKLNLGIKKAPVDNLTDDLLNINLPKRQKAADFF